MCCQVEDDLDKVKNASSQSELMEFFRNFGVNTMELIQQAARRQAVRFLRRAKKKKVFHGCLERFRS